MTSKEAKQLELVMSQYCYVDKNGRKYSVLEIHKKNIGRKATTRKVVTRSTVLHDGTSLIDIINDL